MIKTLQRLKQRKLQTRFRHQCGWCGASIGEDQKVFGAGAKARPGIDLESLQGQVISLQLGTFERRVLAAVAAFDSEAKRDGYDLFFMTCSEECTEEIKRVFAREIELGNQLGYPK